MSRLSARPRPICSRARPEVAPARVPGPTGHPELTSRRVKRNRRLWAAGLLALALVLVLLSTHGGGHPSAAGQRHGGARHHDRRPAAARRQPPARPGLGRRRQAGDDRLRGRRPLPGRDQPRRPSGGRPLRRPGADGARAPLGRRPLHGQPGVGHDRRRVPRPPTQAVRLLRAHHRRERLPGSRGDADHRGQQPRGGLRRAGTANGAGDAGPVRVHDPGHRPECRAGVHPVHDDDPRASTSRSSPPPR